jgi:hypothetical protein
MFYFLDWPMYMIEFVNAQTLRVFFNDRCMPPTGCTSRNASWSSTPTAAQAPSTTGGNGNDGPDVHKLAHKHISNTMVLFAHRSKLLRARGVNLAMPKVVKAIVMVKAEVQLELGECGPPFPPHPRSSPPLVYVVCVVPKSPFTDIPTSRRLD